MKKTYAIWIVDEEKDNYQKVSGEHNFHEARDQVKGMRLSTGILYEYVLEGGNYEDALIRLHDKYEEIARRKRAYIRDQWSRAQELIRDTPLVVHAVPCTAHDGTEYTGYEIENDKSGKYLGFAEIDDLVYAVEECLKDLA